MVYPGIAVSCWSALHKKRYKKQDPPDRSARPMHDTNVGGTAGTVVYFQLRPAPTVISFSFVRRTWSSIPAIVYPSAVVPSWGAAGLPAAIWTRRPVSGHVYCCNSVNSNTSSRNNRSIRLLANLPPKCPTGFRYMLLARMRSCHTCIFDAIQHQVVDAALLPQTPALFLKPVVMLLTLQVSK